jgi:hypothetical protein
MRVYLDLPLSRFLCYLTQLSMSQQRRWEMKICRDEWYPCATKHTAIYSPRGQRIALLFSSNTRWASALYCSHACLRVHTAAFEIPPFRHSGIYIEPSLTLTTLEF